MGKLSSLSDNVMNAYEKVGSAELVLWAAVDDVVKAVQLFPEYARYAELVASVDRFSRGSEFRDDLLETCIPNATNKLRNRILKEGMNIEAIEEVMGAIEKKAAQVSPAIPGSR